MRCFCAQAQKQVDKCEIYLAISSLFLLWFRSFIIIYRKNIVYFDIGIINYWPCIMIDSKQGQIITHDSRCFLITIVKWSLFDQGMQPILQNIPYHRYDNGFPIHRTYGTVFDHCNTNSADPKVWKETCRTKCF